jgi:flagellar hook-associated protein 2
MASAGFGIAPTAGTFSLNGTSISVDPATQSLDDIVAAINASGAGVMAAVVGNGLQLTSNAGPITVGSLADTSNSLAAVKLDASPSVYEGATTWTNTSTGAIGTAQPTATLANARLNTGLVPPPAPSGTFTINGVAINWDSSTDSINRIISRINSANAKVTASYDPVSDTVTLKGTNTGASSIALVDVSGNLLDALGLASAPQTLGKNAEYSIDGGPTRYSTSNLVSNAVPGVTLSLKGPGTTTIGVQQDVATTVNGVKDFVAAYNDALDLVRKDTAIDPTTKKGSIFTGDSMVQGIEMRLRAVLNTAGPGLTTYTSLPAIGLSSGAIGATPGSTNDMVLDESKLTAALNADPNAVTSLLQSPTGPVANLKNYLFSVTSYTGPLNFGQQSADRQITDLDSRIDAFQRRLDMRQQALERRFNNLEAAMAKLQAQSTQLAGQLGQLGSLGSLLGGGK